MMTPALLYVCLLFPTAVDTGYTRNLFSDGLSDWQITGCKADLRDGVLTLSEGDGFVRTLETFGDFVLQWESMPVKETGYDSGVYFRSDLPQGKRKWPRRYQINLKEGEEGNLLGKPSGKSRGLVRDGWNSYQLVVVGQTAQMHINGKKAWQVTGLEQTAGYIGLQSEVPLGGQFRFRNMKLTELGYRSLFNGKDLANWEGASGKASDCWEVQAGNLICNGKKGPWLRSKETFGDFSLRLQYKLKPGGNSGVYVRVPEDGNHHGPASGVEIQVLDDAAPRYNKLKAYQYSASVYAIVPAQPRVSKPAGEWNTLEIITSGHDYKIVHNGTVVVNASVKEVPELKQRRLSGYLGLQNHSEHVWFRHLRIRTAK